MNTCKNGHERTSENTRYDREGYPVCREPLTCLTIADPRDLCDSHNNLCDSHNKRYRSISKLEYESDMWKRGQA